MNHPPRNIHRALNNATTWNLLVWETDLGVHAKIVACYLRTHMNDYQEIAFPAIGRIASYCGVSENTVRKALRDLCGAGYLAQGGIHPTYLTNIYSICTPSGGEPLQEVSHTPSGGEPELTNELTNRESIGFRPPSDSEVGEYSRYIGFDLDPHEFLDFYQSKGWMVGKNKMKDWKAAVRTWKKTREKQNGKGRAVFETGRKLSGAERTRLARQRAYERAAARASDMGCVEPG